MVLLRIMPSIALMRCFWSGAITARVVIVSCVKDSDLLRSESARDDMLTHPLKSAPLAGDWSC